MLDAFWVQPSLSAIRLAAAQGMIAWCDQSAFDGSVFFVREPTLAMQFSQLR